MVKVRVRLFAILRERAGTDSLDIVLEDGARVKDVLSEIELRFPALSALLPGCAVALNGSLADLNEKISNEDEVAILPPVSGGAYLNVTLYL